MKDNTKVHKLRFKGIIFDMDGTLTVPAIDFGRLRNTLGLSPEQDLLGILSTYTDEQKEQHLRIIEEYERKSLENLELQPGVNRVLKMFDAAGIKMAIITRNSKTSTDKVLSHIDVKFDPVLTREFKSVKPDPASIIHIVEYWKYKLDDVLIVGDFRDDIICGKNAGISTCFFANSEKASFAGLADFSVTSFTELKKLILK